MGSKLGGELRDFRYVSGRVRSLEATASGQYAVAEYEWGGFGLRFVRFITEQPTDLQTAEKAFW